MPVTWHAAELIVKWRSTDQLTSPTRKYCVPGYFLLEPHWSPHPPTQRSIFARCIATHKRRVLYLLAMMLAYFQHWSKLSKTVQESINILVLYTGLMQHIVIKLDNALGYAAANFYFQLNFIFHTYINIHKNKGKIKFNWKWKLTATDTSRKLTETRRNRGRGRGVELLPTTKKNSANNNVWP